MAREAWAVCLNYTHPTPTILCPRQILLYEIEQEKKAEQEKSKNLGMDEDEADSNTASLGVESTSELIRRIYAENREKRKEERARLFTDKTVVELGDIEYRHDPSKHPAVKAEIAKFEQFFPKLRAQLQYWRTQDVAQHKALAVKYVKQYKK